MVLRNNGQANYEVFDLLVPSKVFTDVEKKPGTIHVTGIKDYNNKLFIAFKETDSMIIAKNLEETGYLSPNLKKEDMFTDRKYLRLSDITTVYKNVEYKDFILEGYQLLIHLKNKTDTDKDFVLYIYNYDQISTARDVTQINKIICINNKLFIDAKDMDRITDKERFALLLYDPYQANYDLRIRNLVLGMEPKNWEEIEGGLAVNGFEADIKRSKVYMYAKDFDELLGNFEVSYWRKLENKIFTSGKDTDNNNYSFYSFNANDKKLLRNNFQVLKAEKAQNDYYFVHAVEQTNDTPYKNKKILFIYNEKTGQFIDMVVGTELTDILFFNK